MLPFSPLRSCPRHLAVLFMVLATFTGGSVLTAQQVPKAVPVEQPRGKAPPRAMPVDNTGIPQQPEPGKGAGPDEDLYEYAMLAYGQKDYAIALKPFNDYVKTYPQGRRAAEAWFHLGECYFRTGAQAEASRAYKQVVALFPKTESAGSAAYRLGAMAYANRDYAGAAQLFDMCERLSTVQEIRLVSLHNKALSYKMAGQKAKSLTAYKALAAVPPPNQYRLPALLEMATAAMDAGKNSEALEDFSSIITLLADGSDAATLSDALLKRGLLLNAASKYEAAIKDFKRVLDMKEATAERRGAAVFGLIEAAYQKGEYDLVVDTYTRNATALPPEDLRPKEYLLVGMAHKLRKAYRQAVGLFLLLERTYPDSPEAFEAGYQKLLCFYQLGDKDIPEFSQRFEEKYGKSHRDHEYLAMSRLIRADWYFTKGEYQKSSDAYSAIDITKVPENFRASASYRKGFAQAESGNFNDAISSLSYFITNYPKDPNLPIALAQRGVCQKSVRNFDKALEDFGRIIKQFPDHSAAEMAYYQSGQIKVETRDMQGVITDYEAFTAKFPNSPALAGCYYWLGRAYAELKAYSKAIEPLHKAIARDSKEYLDKASPILISCEMILKDLEGLAREVDAYISANPHAAIVPAALKYLGGTYFERGDYRSAARYLRHLSTPGDPGNTEPAVWNYLGIALAEIGDHKNAIQALDNYLAAPPGNGRPKALYYKGRALLALGRYDDATQCVTEGLQLEKEGKLHAQLTILQGDIAMEHGNDLKTNNDDIGATAQWRLAAGNYVVISQIFVDPNITPEALEKAAKAMEKLGDTEKAATFRKQLKLKYPNYVPKDKR